MRENAALFQLLPAISGKFAHKESPWNNNEGCCLPPESRALTLSQHWGGPFRPALVFMADGQKALSICLLLIAEQCQGLGESFELINPTATLTRYRSVALIGTWFELHIGDG